AHRRLLSVNVAALTPKERAEHDRTIGRQAQQLSMLRRVTDDLPVQPVERDRPRLYKKTSACHGPVRQGEARQGLAWHGRDCSIQQTTTAAQQQVRWRLIPAANDSPVVFTQTGGNERCQEHQHESADSVSLCWS
ncbi:MAG: hypothetical protein ACK528_12280, partial [Alphaproteobacteria bacterium]